MGALSPHHIVFFSTLQANLLSEIKTIHAADYTAKNSNIVDMHTKNLPLLVQYLIVI